MSMALRDDQQFSDGESYFLLFSLAIEPIAPTALALNESPTSKRCRNSSDDIYICINVYP